MCARLEPEVEVAVCARLEPEVEAVERRVDWLAIGDDGKSWWWIVLGLRERVQNVGGKEKITHDRLFIYPGGASRLCGHNCSWLVVVVERKDALLVNQLRVTRVGRAHVCARSAALKHVSILGVYGKKKLCTKYSPSLNGHSSLPVLCQNVVDSCRRQPPHF